MSTGSNIIGIDIGSVSIAVAETSPEMEIINIAYDFHHGNIIESLKKILHNFDLSGICGIASTSSTPSILRVNGQYDNRVAIIDAARHFHKNIGSILLVGAEKFGIIIFDKNGNYLNFKANTSCAAGTGSFLDQQAKRLSLSGIEELSRIAFNNRGSIPKIASRCAVFAKTDLIHAQQEGYSLDEICDGLCHGLAKNIVDTLFIGEGPNSPVIFTGGVSRNRAVVDHIQSLIGKDIVVHEMSHIYGAIGAAFNLSNELQVEERIRIKSADDIFIHKTEKKSYFFDPLELKLSDYPDFNSFKKYEYSADNIRVFDPVEVDIYEELESSRKYEVYLGVDVGSTSTKAVLLDKDNVVLAGFYTKTAGRPVQAVQQIFASIDDAVKRNGIDLQVVGAGTTGSGRKLTGKILRADIIIDEITAHARAACELNRDVDTIIEIGGQDSKFTTLQNGMVTFSIMNNVCAAGTGSFIEEQAQKLGCPLPDYSDRTEGQRAPIASDRCTVFMERDINHYLSHGYSVDEALASVLHSIRENYLTKVAIEGSIGDNISFQGATAKNRALVAAFEQRLKKPIYVSRYCHLTGALGTALILSERSVQETGFRGIDLYKKDIPIQSETCELCTNHCKITIADIDGEKVAYGFLCGRDYDTKKHVNNNTSGFDLLKERKRIFSFVPEKEFREKFSIGIPAALHLYEDLPMWKKFFDEFSIRVVTSEHYIEAVKVGKELAGAEFCAPLTALYGHIRYLMDKADYIFLPFYLEKKIKEKGVRRQYCYYTQFSSSITSGIGDSVDKKRFLMPLVNYLYGSFYTRVQLYRMLKSVSKKRISFFDVSSAYKRALEFKNSGMLKLKDIYKRELKEAGDISVALVGRPYTILSASMNNGIPDIFSSHGIKTFFQDMIPYKKEDIESLKPLLNEIHWYYASEILKVAKVIAQTKGVYPVFITSFKCSPDSFAIDYFKKIMDSHGKPYLILQLDELDSSTGYETRIEAAIRSFRNHSSSRLKKEPVKYASSIIPVNDNQISGKTLIYPNWDSMTNSLIVANLRSVGIDARLLEESETSIQKSLRHNTGQCIPINIIAQDFIDYIENHNLDPANTMLWMVRGSLACNLRLFPHHIRYLLNSHGKGMEKAGVYAGELSLADISRKLPLNTYFAFMFGGLIRKMGCRIRPYEREKGATDRAIEMSMNIMTDTFLGNRPKEKAVAEVVSYFEDIKADYEPRPKVAIFGDLYVRDNEVMNQNLIRFIEENGGEVIATPYSSYAKMIARPYIKKWLIEGQYLNVLNYQTIISTLSRLEKKYYKYFERILKEPDHEFNESPKKILSEYNIRIENTGESMDNILKIFYIRKYYPDVALFVQTNPAFCCPSLVTEAMSKDIEKKTGVPVVSITYDGTGGNKNEIIIPYLKYPRNEYAGRN